MKLLFVTHLQTASSRAETPARRERLPSSAPQGQGLEDVLQRHQSALEVGTVNVLFGSFFQSLSLPGGRDVRNRPLCGLP